MFIKQCSLSIFGQKSQIISQYNLFLQFETYSTQRTTILVHGERMDQNRGKVYLCKSNANTTKLSTNNTITDEGVAPQCTFAGPT